MKVVFLTGAFRVGGSETQLLNLLLNLPDTIQRVVVTLRTGSMDGALEKAGIRQIVIGRGTSSSFSLLGSANRFRRVLLQEKPDLVQSHLPGTNIIAALQCKLLGVPHILMEEGLGLSRPLWEKVLRRIAFKFPSRFVCNSPAIKKRLISREKVPLEKITLIRNAVVFNSSRDRTETREELGLSEDHFMVFTAASLKPIKGVDYLIRGFCLFKEDFDESRKKFVLCIAGDGRCSKEYQTIASDNPGIDVRFLGIRDDVSDLMKAADVYVSPSLSEGLSNSIIEAMYAGTPIIATNVGGSTSLVGDEDLGVLIEPGSAEAVAEALKRLFLVRPSSERLEKARRFVEEKFSTERVVKQFTALYREV